MNEVRVEKDQASVALAAAEIIISAATFSIAERGAFRLALAGGSTPRTLYETLASVDYRSRLNWARVHLYWGDERCVPPDHDASNYRMTRATLLNHAPIPPENVYRLAGEAEPEQAALDYEKLLRDHLGEAGAFDVTLLGMGDDGHTASLFPGTAAIHERERWVIAHHVPQLDAWRLTLTPPALNRSRQVMFLVTGEKKAATLKQVHQGEHQPDVLPSQIIQPQGDLLWLVDQSAAAELS